MLMYTRVTTNKTIKSEETDTVKYISYFRITFSICNWFLTANCIHNPRQPNKPQKPQWTKPMTWFRMSTQKWIRSSRQHSLPTMLLRSSANLLHSPLFNHNVYQSTVYYCILPHGWFMQYMYNAVVTCSIPNICIEYQKLSPFGQRGGKFWHFGDKYGSELSGYWNFLHIMPTNNFDQAWKIWRQPTNEKPNNIVICHSPIASVEIICPLRAVYNSTAARVQRAWHI